MYEKELYTKSECKEIFVDFSETTNAFWQLEEHFYYVSYDGNVAMDIDPHLPVRCVQRSVMSDTFFMAMEAFFTNEEEDELTGEPLPTSADLNDNDWVVLVDLKNSLRFVFKYVGYDFFTNKDVIFCKTVVPFYGYEAHKFRKGNRVFEIETKQNGELQVNFVNAELRFE